MFRQGIAAGRQNDSFYACTEGHTPPLGAVVPWAYVAFATGALSLAQGQGKQTDNAPELQGDLFSIRAHGLLKIRGLAR